MCRGGSPPAPPPDYTAQKEKFAADTLAQYQADADAYNEKVDAFNTELSGYSDALSSGQSAFDSASIYDLYDDPSTSDVNEDALAGYRSDLQNFDYDTLTNTDFGEQPLFNPVVQSPYGPVTISGIPELSTANTGLADSLYDDGQSLLSDINSLYDERQTAFDEFNTTAAGVANQFDAVDNSISDANIASDLTSLRTDLGAASRSATDIANNPFLAQSQYANANIAGNLADLQSQLDNLYAARSSEYDRIANYEAGLNTSANAFAGEVTGLGITDMDRINEIENEIRALERESRQFNSMLGYDFSDERAGFGDAMTGIGDIRAQRKAEEDRVSAYQDSTLEGIRGLRDESYMTDMYDLGGIDAMDAALSDFREDAGNFTSVLDYSVPGLDDYYSRITDRLGGLREDRASALDAIEGRIGGVTGGLGDIALYNEGGFGDSRRRLQDIGFDLGQFTGGRVDEIAANIDAGQRQVDAKLRELQAYRASLEEEMIELLGDIRTRDYYDFEDVASGRDDVYNKEKEVRLYQAQNAMDEIDDMLSSLKDQDRRLKSDAQAVLDRQASSGAGVSFGGMAGNRMGFTPMTTSQYNAFVNSQEDDQFGSYNPSAFSNALGVIRV
tara:strand:- start:13552 stop:15396 length:1845 start_codon:yes stop_codon:yes gene_type:complete